MEKAGVFKGGFAGSAGSAGSTLKFYLGMGCGECEHWHLADFEEKIINLCHNRDPSTIY